MVGDEHIGTPKTEYEGEVGRLFLIEGCEMVDLKRKNAGLERVR